MPFKLPWSEPEPTPSKIPLPKVVTDLPSKLPQLPISIKVPDFVKDLKLKLPSVRLPQLTKNQQRIAVGVASCAALAIAIRALPRKPPRHVLPSPRDAVDELSPDERADLPYAPNALPGGRDIESPYGTIRVFEWGPDTGERVMLVHGISTPCVSLADLAWEFSKKGYRVILFDLYARGYSAGPDPAQTPYDARLYTTQLLTVHASAMASLPAGASPRIHVVGYSLGATLSVSFTRYFPHLVASLTLIAPSGLLRPTHLGTIGRMLYSPSTLIPSFLIPALTRWRITPALHAPHISAYADDDPDRPSNPATSEEAVPRAGGSTPSFDAAPISLLRPSITVSHVVRWQIQNHPGFLPAFISTMSHAPIYAPQPDWTALAEILAAQRSGRSHRSRRHKSSSSSSKHKDRDREKEKKKEKERRKEKERKEKEKERRSSKSSRSGKEDVLTDLPSSSGSSHRSRHEQPGIHGGKVLMVLGSQDPVIPMDETVQDAIQVLGEDGVQLAIVDGGHELPIVQADEVARFIISFLSNESLRIVTRSGSGAWDSQSEASSVYSSIRSGH